MNHPIDDPYAACDQGQCNHDLARAVTVDELLAGDGPFPPSHMIVNLASARAMLFDEVDAGVELRRAG